MLKFAGDASIILWPPRDEPVPVLAHRALQAALELQEHLDAAQLGSGVTLSVKVGVGIGRVVIAHVGGVRDGGGTRRREYVATGSPLTQAFESEHHAVAGQVVASPEAWAAVSGSFEPAPG